MKWVIFDLDNTIYDHALFIKPALRRVAHYLSKESKISAPKIYKKAMTLWEQKSSMYPFLFNDLCKEFGINGDIKKIVAIFNETKPKLKPFEGFLSVINKIRKNEYKVAIITDGNSFRQRNKIKQLGITRLFDKIIFTADIKSSKLEKDPFLKIDKSINDQSFFVGDNPDLDFQGACLLGIRTVRVKSGEFKKRPKNEYIEFEIRDLKQLPQIILHI